MKKLYNWRSLGLMAGLLFSGSFISDVSGITMEANSPKKYTLIVEENVNTAPEIVVSANSVEIPNGANVPQFVNFTDFGDLEVGTSGMLTYTIANQGNTILQLTGASRVRIAGLHQADFTVTTQPGAAIETGQETSFTVTFSPGGAGMRYGAIVIESNDPDKHPYVFRIQGKGVDSGIGTGLEEFNQSSMLVYPTLTMGCVTVNAEDITRILVFDMTGKSVREDYIAHVGSHTLDLTDLSDGIYLIKVKYRQGWNVKKVIKQ